MVPVGYASLDVRFAQNPGRAHTSLRRRQLFQPNQPQNSSRCDAECGGTFTDGHLVAGLPLSLTVDQNRMVVAQRADTLRSPALSVCRTALIPIQDRGDPRVWFDPRQRANDLQEIIAGDIPMLAGADLLKLYLRVIPALPMQYEAYGLAFTRGDDLFQSDTKEAFLVLRQTVRIVPEYGRSRAKDSSSRFCVSVSGPSRPCCNVTSSASTCASVVSAWFQRRSSSAATSRFAGSTASYWRRARVTS